MKYISAFLGDIGFDLGGVGITNAVQATFSLAWMQEHSGIAEMCRKTSPVRKPDEAIMREGRTWLKHASGIYGKTVANVAVEVAYGAARTKFSSDMDFLCTVTGVPPEDVIMVNWTSDGTYGPAHGVLVDRKERQVVVIFRGTLTFSDLLTDMAMESTPFTCALGTGTGHIGWVSGAKRMCEKLRPVWEKALADNPDCNLTFTGHSLGAAMAQLVAMIVGPTTEVAGRQGPVPVRAFGYGAVPVVDLAIARKASSYVTTFLEGADTAPRTGKEGALELKATLIKLHHDAAVRDRAQRLRSRKGVVPSAEEKRW